MKDIAGSQFVEVVIRDDGKVVWINIDGKCELRACEIGQFFLDDRRKKEWTAKHEPGEEVSDQPLQ